MRSIATAFQNQIEFKYPLNTDDPAVSKGICMSTAQNPLPNMGTNNWKSSAIAEIKFLLLAV